jgi:outer membrane protein TolC
VLAAQEKQLLAADAGARTTYAIDTIQAEEDLRVGAELVDSSREALKLAEAAYREAQSAYSSGTANYSQLSESQRSWIDADFGFENARYQYVLRMARFFVAAGWPVEDLVEVLKKGKAA